jgi:hypothetical protein
MGGAKNRENAGGSFGGERFSAKESRLPATLRQNDELGRCVRLEAEAKATRRGAKSFAIYIVCTVHRRLSREREKKRTREQLIAL